MTDVAVFTLTADEARALTLEIKGAAERIYALLLRAHEGRAWSALGYESWRDYAMAEFGMSQSHAYRLLDQARVVRDIEAASSSPIGELPNEGQARELAKVPAEERADVWRETLDRTDNRPTAAAVKESAELVEERRKRAELHRDNRGYLLRVAEMLHPPSHTPGFVTNLLGNLGERDDHLDRLTDRLVQARQVLDEIVEGLTR